MLDRLSVLDPLYEKLIKFFYQSGVTRNDCEGKKVPLFIGCAGRDQMVSPTLPQDLTQSLSENEENQFEVKVYPDMQHGFAARPRHEDVTQCMAAFEDAVEFFNRHQMK